MLSGNCNFTSVEMAVVTSDLLILTCTSAAEEAAS